MQRWTNTLSRQSSGDRRIKSAAEVSSHRNVGPQAYPSRVQQQRAELFGQCRLLSVRHLSPKVAILEVEFPIFDQLAFAILIQQRMPRRKLLDSFAHRVRGE